MSTLVRTLASVFVGLMLAATNFAPIVGWFRFLENRRRVFNAVLLFGASFLFMMAAVWIATVDLVVQYEDQGLFFWNPLLTATTILAVIGIACFLLANATMPKMRDYFLTAEGPWSQPSSKAPDKAPEATVSEPMAQEPMPAPQPMEPQMPPHKNQRPSTQPVYSH